MTTQEILDLDCSKPENVKELKKALGKIKPLQKYKANGYLVEDMQEVLIQIHKRYELEMQYIHFMVVEKYDNFYWSASIRGTKNGEWFGNVYAITIWEMMAKILVYMFSLIKQGKVEVIYVK